MSKIFTWFSVSSVMLIVFTHQAFPDGKLRVIGCDVGQGDAILITQGFTQVLVDGGPSDKVIDCLKEHVPWFDNSLELVVLTHPEQDHMRGLIGVIDSYRVEMMLASNVANKSKTFGTFRDAVIAKDVEIHPPLAGEQVKVGKMSFWILWPSEKHGDKSVWEPQNETNNYNKLAQGEVLGAYKGNLNDISIVGMLEYEQVSILLTGDISAREEQALLSRGVIRPVNVLKVAHHGSKFSSSQSFLDATRPKWALISVGKNNSFGHPTRGVLSYLDIVGAQILRTDERGTIILVSDGDSFWLAE